MAKLLNNVAILYSGIVVFVFIIICGSAVRRGLSTVYFTYYMLHCYQVAAEMDMILVVKDNTWGIFNSNWIT